MWTLFEVLGIFWNLEVPEIFHPFYVAEEMRGYVCIFWVCDVHWSRVEEDFIASFPKNSPILIPNLDSYVVFIALRLNPDPLAPWDFNLNDLLRIAIWESGPQEIIVFLWKGERHHLVMPKQNLVVFLRLCWVFIPAFNFPLFGQVHFTEIKLEMLSKNPSFEGDLVRSWGIICILVVLEGDVLKLGARSLEPEEW